MIGTGIKRGTAELAVLSILEGGPMHGYEMARRIEQETKGALRFTLAALLDKRIQLHPFLSSRGRHLTTEPNEKVD